MNDVTVEKESPAMEQNVNTDAVVANDDTSVDAVSEVDGGAEEKADLTPEQKLEEVSRQAESLEQKVKRQTASYNALQKKLQEERQLREQLQVKAPVEELVEPKLEDFDTLDEYRQADREYVRKSAEKEFKEKIEKEDFSGKNGWRRPSIEEKQICKHFFKNVREVGRTINLVEGEHVKECKVRFVLGRKMKIPVKK